MHINAKDRQILQILANEISEAANLPKQQDKIELWRASNSLKPKRPMVLADPQNGWDELVPDSDLHCSDPFAKSIELKLRRTIFRHKHIHDDYPILANFYVDAIIRKSDYGIRNETLSSDRRKGAYKIKPSIVCHEDISRLKHATIEYDKQSTHEQFELIQDVLGNILDVKIRKVNFCRSGLTRVLIHLRGLEQVMFDMYDNPEMLHEMMSFLRDEQIREFDFYEKEGLLSLNNTPDSVTGSGSLALTDELPSKDFSGLVHMKDMFAWGESQEFVGVGPEQFNEFVLQYQVPILNRFGLVDYGCCEALDQKFDLIIKNIPNLRWISVSPWANQEIAADKLKNKYVFVYKPNPSRICTPEPDYVAAEKDMRDMLEIAKGCVVNIIMKDTSTFCNEPERIERWTDIAMNIVTETQQDFSQR